VVALEATADEGYEFVKWVGGPADGVTNPSTSITMQGDYSVTATFAEEEVPPAQYSLSISSTAGGSVTAPGEGTFTYDAGTVVALEAAAEEGYRFVKWVGEPVDGVTSPSITISMQGDYSVTANFAEEEVPPAQYTLSISSGAGGSVTAPGEGSFTYDEGAVVGIAVAAEEGYRFVKWVGAPVDGVTHAATSITMVADYSVTATFAEKDAPPGQYSLTVSSTSGGSVTVPGEGTFTYAEGTVVALVAEAEEGYDFVKWVGGPADGGTNPSTTVTMEGDYSITASFTEEVVPVAPYVPIYALRVSSTAGGSAFRPGEGTFAYREGRQVRLVARPEDGYKFVGWSGSVGTIADAHAASTTITVQGHYSVTASFEPEIPPVQYSLTVSSTAGGSVTAPGEGTFTYEEGKVVNLVAVPGEGYRFAGWTGDVDTIALVNAASTTITMQADYRITAQFHDGEWGAGVSVTGVTKEVDSAVLPEATVILYHNGEAVANAVSDEHGLYTLMIWAPGDYEVVATKEAFSDELHLMSVTQPTPCDVDFVGDLGLIPRAPCTSYVLSCISLWKYGERPFQLSTSKVLEVISAWVFQGED